MIFEESVGLLQSYMITLQTYSHTDFCALLPLLLVHCDGRRRLLGSKDYDDENDDNNDDEEYGDYDYYKYDYD